MIQMRGPVSGFGYGCSHDNSDKSEEDYDDKEVSALLNKLTQEADEGVDIDYSVDFSQEDIDDDDGSKCQKNNNRSSIAEFFLPEPQGKKQRFKDSKDIILVRYGNSWRIMKKGEAYAYKQNSTKIYVVDEFIFGEPKKRARCRIFQKIHHTFLKEEGKVLEDMFPFVMHQSPAIVYVDMLGERMNQTPSSCLIYCEESLKASGNFGVTYKFKKENVQTMAETVPLQSETDPTVLELFCGAGGMSEGFKQNGFHIKWAIDNDKDAISTFMYNHSPRNTLAFDEDINEWFQKVKEQKKVYKNIRPRFHIHASPPCQSFSKANRFGGKNDESNTQKTKVSIEIVEHFMPLSFSMENVLGLLDSANVIHIQQAMASLILCGYQIRVMVLNAANYGDPQNRERVFLFATKWGINLPDRPKETHGNLPSQIPVTRSGDTLCDLEEVELSSGPGIVQLNDEDDTSITYNHSVESSKLLAGSKKLDQNRPADTIRAANGVRHYKFGRGLSNREYARLQSFPDSHRFLGPPTKVRRQIGNAVPCRLSFAVAEVIKKSCYQKTSSKKSKLR